MRDVAVGYLSAGLCVLPAKRAEKRPAIGAWKQYQQRLPTEAELSAWLASPPNGHDAICIICGAVSGNAEIIDFDGGGEHYTAWRDRIPAELRDKVVVERTPSGGYHVIYRCSMPVCGNLKLAQRKDGDKVVTLIETRGEGGLFLCDPTPGYELIQGDFYNLPVLSEAERDVLLQTAWELNEYVPEPVGASFTPVATGGDASRPALGGPADRPGDDYNARGDVRALLTKHGWQCVRGGDNEYWRRPSKANGWSATLKNRVFYVFSTSVPPFEAERGYAPFAVYAMLEHNGEFEAAAQALRREGYGGAFTDAASELDISGFRGAGGGTAPGGAPAPAETDELSSPRQFKLIRADQIEMRPPDWLLRGMLERDTLALAFGDPGSGKSFMTIDWACRVATGTSWRGHPVTAGPVVYVAGEGQQGFGRRTRAWQEHHGVSLTGAPLFIAPAVAIPDPGQLAELAAAIDDQVAPPALIVLDTLARCFGGGDENSTQDMSRFVSACDTIRRQYDCTILIVHHTGHGDKNRARGAIALKAALDAEYRLTSEEGLVLTATKMKDAEMPPPLAMELVTVELPGMVDEYGNAITSAAIDVVDAEAGAILSQASAARPRGKWQQLGLEVAKRLMAISDEGQVSLRDWHAECEAAGMRQSTRYDVLTRLHEQGTVIVGGDALIPT